MATGYDGVRRLVDTTAYPLVRRGGGDARRRGRVLGARPPEERGLMRARVWGCRGSLAAPGADTVRYGGNTSCLEVRLESGHTLVLDAGTGMRALGAAMEPDAHRRAAHPPHAPAPRPSPGPGVLPPAVPARPRRAHLGAGVAGAEPRRPHRHLPLAAAVPGAPGRHPRPAHLPRRARGGGDHRVGDGAGREGDPPGAHRRVPHRGGGTGARLPARSRALAGRAPARPAVRVDQRLRRGP